MGRYQVGFVLLTELVPEKWGAAVGTSINLGYASAYLYITLYYRYISRKSYPLFWAGLVLNVMAVGATFLIPESGKWLVSVKQYRKARESFEWIAKFNGVKNFKLNTFGSELTENEEALQNNKSILDRTASVAPRPYEKDSSVDH